MRRLKRRNTASLSDLVLTQLSAEESLSLMEEVEADESASEELELLIALEEFAGSDDAGIFRDRVSAADDSSRGWGFPRPEWLLGRAIYIPIGALLGVVIFFMVSVLRIPESNPFDPLAAVHFSEVEFRTREATDNELSSALGLFAVKKGDEGIRHLERFISLHPESPLLPYVYYCSGVAYLAAARRNLLGLVSWYDTALVTKGLDHLIRAEVSGYPASALEDLRWYRAKGYLMRCDTRSASQELESIVEGHGPRSVEAGVLLSEVDSIATEWRR